MKNFLLFLIISPIVGVFGLKNGHALDENGEVIECPVFINHYVYCTDMCKIYKAQRGDCCNALCYCINLPDDAPTLEIDDGTKKYCEFKVLG
uniref:Sodium channel toxin meuNa13 n=1 Tax=Mesobuthus eupeus TaxID=34648 RepID=A0A146CIX6_MESEU|nr:sodium channel toxin meuNa13 [Mesobuthus eupeus]